MSELCFSSSVKSRLSSLLLSDFFLFCSFILSHPLYFSYFIFFSPYLLKLFSFLSPLFLTTTAFLLLLALICLVHKDPIPELSGSILGFILSTYHAVIERLNSETDNGDEEFHSYEEFEAYRLVFDASTFDAREKPDVVVSGLKSEENCLEALHQASTSKCSSQLAKLESTHLAMKGKSLEGLLQEPDESENMTCCVEEKKVEPLGSMLHKVHKEPKEEPLMRRGSEAAGTKISDGRIGVGTDNGREYSSKVAANSERLVANVNIFDDGGKCISNVMGQGYPTLGSSFGSCGSMRKEKEWKRTLACKLFEERRDVDGGEGMDLLWETYEVDSSKVKPKGSIKKRNKKKNEVEFYADDYDYDEEETNGQLCCLQALKLSAGKMNLGMGRPNLVRMSKAIKGIGWLRRVSRLRKKGYD